jgi:hypothetical protein
VNTPGKYHSQLFTLRLWREPGVHPPGEVRLKLQHLRSGEVRYFCEWPALIAYLLAVVEDDKEDASHQHRPDSSA